MASPKLTREIVYEKKAANSEGMGRFAHKLRQFYEFYLIASFLKITTGKFFPPKQLKHDPVLDPFFGLSPPDFFQVTGYSISQHTASQPHLPIARLSLLCISISMVKTKEGVSEQHVRGELVHWKVNLSNYKLKSC